MICRTLLIMTLLLALAFPTLLHGHEVKVFASNLRLPAEGGRTTVYLGYGHRMPIDDLLDAQTIEKFEVVSPDGARKNLVAQGLGVHAQVARIDSQGIHRVIAVRRPSIYSYVYDSQGNRSLKRGGKSEHGELKVDTATRYQDCGVALIAVGEPAKAPAPLGLPAEIVPLAAPSQWRAGRDINLQVLVGQKPKEFTDLIARPLGFKPDDAWSYATETNRDGIARFRPDKAGTWLVKVSIKTPSKANESKDFDWNSVTTTLTLEIEP
jgi:uncharacterized GH25 family protein